MLPPPRGIISDPSTESVRTCQQGSFAVDIIEEGCTQHSHSYPGDVTNYSGPSL